MRTFLALLVFLLVSSPALAAPGLGRLAFWHGGIVPPIPVTQTIHFGALTPSGYGCADLGFGGAGFLGMSDVGNGQYAIDTSTNGFPCLVPTTNPATTGNPAFNPQLYYGKTPLVWANTTLTLRQCLDGPACNNPTGQTGIVNVAIDAGTATVATRNPAPYGLCTSNCDSGAQNNTEIGRLMGAATGSQLQTQTLVGCDTIVMRPGWWNPVSYTTTNQAGYDIEVPPTTAAWAIHNIAQPVNSACRETIVAQNPAAGTDSNGNPKRGSPYDATGTQIGPFKIQCKGSSNTVCKVGTYGPTGVALATSVNPRVDFSNITFAAKSATVAVQLFQTGNGFYGEHFYQDFFDSTSNGNIPLDVALASGNGAIDTAKGSLWVRQSYFKGFDQDIIVNPGNSIAAAGQTYADCATPGSTSICDNIYEMRSNNGFTCTDCDYVDVKRNFDFNYRVDVRTQAHADNIQWNWDESFYNWLPTAGTVPNAGPTFANLGFINIFQNGSNRGSLMASSVQPTGWVQGGNGSDGVHAGSAKFHILLGGSTAGIYPAGSTRNGATIQWPGPNLTPLSGTAISVTGNPPNGAPACLGRQLGVPDSGDLATYYVVGCNDTADGANGLTIGSVGNAGATQGFDITFQDSHFLLMQPVIANSSGCPVSICDTATFYVDNVDIEQNYALDGDVDFLNVNSVRNPIVLANLQVTPVDVTQPLQTTQLKTFVLSCSGGPGPLGKCLNHAGLGGSFSQFLTGSVAMPGCDVTTTGVGAGVSLLGPQAGGACVGQSQDGGTVGPFLLIPNAAGNQYNASYLSSLNVALPNLTTNVASSPAALVALLTPANTAAASGGLVSGGAPGPVIGPFWPKDHLNQVCWNAASVNFDPTVDCTSVSSLAPH